MDAPWANGLESVILTVLWILVIAIPAAVLFIPWERSTGRRHGTHRGED